MKWCVDCHETPVEHRAFIRCHHCQMEFDREKDRKHAALWGKD
jgi:hypothetical protein